MSLGRKPSPGGETNVCRMLERMVAGPPDLGCWIRPTPSLLAEPSRPRDIIFGGGRGGGDLVWWWWKEGEEVVWWVGEKVIVALRLSLN